MKNLYLAFILSFAFGTIAMAQGTIEPSDQMDMPANGPTMSFESLEVPYGEISQHSEPLRNLTFTNTGTEPLVIKSARGSCGCTVPIWPKEPIMPGETSNIEIRYATDRLGKFSKTVTITTNEQGDPHVIKVHGNVSKSDENESVPVAPASVITGKKKIGQ